MERFYITNMYSLIALNNIEVISRSFKLIEKFISIGLVLDLINNEVIVYNDGYYKLNKSKELMQFEKNIITQLGIDNKNLIFEEIIESSKKIKPNVREKLVQEIIQYNIDKGSIDIVSSLLSLDVNYEVTGINIREYRTSFKVYNTIINHVREINESNAYYCLLWLLLQSGDIIKIFSHEEIEAFEDKFEQFHDKSELVLKLGEEAELQPLLVEWRKFSEAKTAMFKNGFGLGVVSRFPVLERIDTVFIATDIDFSNAKKSVETAILKLADNGHIVKLAKGGDDPVLEVDNVLYELSNDIVRSRQGVRLRRVSG